MRLLLLPALAAVVLVTGCGVEDDGPRTTQNRSVGTFTRLADDDSVDVRLHVGEGPQRVRVSAGEKVVDDVKTEVKDGTLQVRFDHHGWGGGSVEVEAWVPALSAITTDGSGDIHADGVAGDAFEARSDGSGDLHLADLDARSAKVKVGGSGDVDVRASERLDVDVDGSGDVRYYGDPALTQRIDGSGDVKHAG